MAREEKRFELKPVDDVEEPSVPVIRLESEETMQRTRPARLAVQPEVVKVSQRLDVPAREDFETRTHQPGIEALMDTDEATPDQMEHAWGKDSTHHHGIPWGWFVLIGLILAGGVIWSLSGGSEVKKEKIRVATETVLGDEAKEEREAGKLIERIEAVTKKFFETTSVETLTRLVRHPERVRTLMDAYYGGKPIPATRLVRTKLLQPLTLDNKANFWMVSVELANRETRNLIVEILDSGEPRIDWETVVCYQPMKWDAFANERPVGTSFDFRVYLEPDNFFTHEFADSKQWNCFRLTALNSDETLFGYAKANEETARALLDLLSRNQGRKTSVILRLNIPEGIRSRRGVVIEKVLSNRWMFIDPPDA